MTDENKTQAQDYPQPGIPSTMRDGKGQLGVDVTVITNPANGASVTYSDLSQDGSHACIQHGSNAAELVNGRVEIECLRGSLNKETGAVENVKPDDKGFCDMEARKPLCYPKPIQ